MEAFEGWSSRVDFYDDFVGHLDEFGGGADGGPGNDAAVFGDGAGFDDGYVEFVAGFVEGVEAGWMLAG